MPTTAAGPHLDSGQNARSDNAELTWRTKPQGLTAHFLIYHNRARMGRYADAVALARATENPADITLTRRGGRGKIGDGRLNYGSERIFEAYYNYQATRQISFAADLQIVQNPGYNRDRGPAVIVGTRLLVAL